MAKCQVAQRECGFVVDATKCSKHGRISFVAGYAHCAWEDSKGREIKPKGLK